MQKGGGEVFFFHFQLLGKEKLVHIHYVVLSYMHPFLFLPYRCYVPGIYILPSGCLLWLLDNMSNVSHVKYMLYIIFIAHLQTVQNYDIHCIYTCTIKPESEWPITSYRADMESSARPICSHHLFVCTGAYDKLISKYIDKQTKIWPLRHMESSSRPIFSHHLILYI